MSRDYRQINLFMLVSLSALVKEKSVTAAARRLGISQPALSQILSKLRRLSADPIVVHGANAMIPTVRGLQLADLAERTIEMFDASFWQSSKFDPAESSKLFAIMTSDYVQMVLFPALLKRTLSQSPRSSIRIVSPDLVRFAETHHPNVLFLDAPFPVPDIVISMTWHERNHREPGHLWLRALARDSARSLQPI